MSIEYLSFPQYRGGAMYRLEGSGAFDVTGWVTRGHSAFRLRDDVYDLQASSCYLARRHDALNLDRYISARFQAGFSRAARTLVQRRLLYPLRVIARSTRSKTRKCCNSLMATSSMAPRGKSGLSQERAYD